MKMIWLSLIASGLLGQAFDQPWQSELARMPLQPAAGELNRTNCVSLMLHSFQKSSAVKAIVFMPGATDELNLFRRVHAKITATAPTLLDAVTALTNQTLIRATFKAPLLLLHTDEDPLELLIQIDDEKTATLLKERRFAASLISEDRDWDFIQPILKGSVKIDIRPWRFSKDSWHFYRHSFAEYDLSGWEAIAALAHAGKTRVVVSRKRVSFFPDTRFMTRPAFEWTPGKPLIPAD